MKLGIIAAMALAASPASAAVFTGIVTSGSLSRALPAEKGVLHKITATFDVAPVTARSEIITTLHYASNNPNDTGNSFLIPFSAVFERLSGNTYVSLIGYPKDFIQYQNGFQYSYVYTMADLRLEATFGSFPVNYSILFENVGSIPEPSAWAMMIAGFGLAGYAMRQRTKGTLAHA